MNEIFIQAIEREREKQHCFVCIAIILVQKFVSKNVFFSYYNRYSIKYTGIPIGEKERVEKCNGNG